MITDKIDREERKDLTVGCLALALAFTLVFIRGGWDSWTDLVVIFIISIITVGAAFILHEMAHKFMAMRFGYYAAFRKDNGMLLMGVALAALVGIVFAAPGATVIYAQPGREMTSRENGIISIAGPAVNLVLGVVFFGILIAGFAVQSIPVILLGTMGISVNGMIAFFNLLPISVLDGKKVLAWNPVFFVVAIVLALGMILFATNYGGVMDMVIAAIFGW
ncbi:zinc metalloprotease [Methanogenium organophilum]|uniref:Peptidase M50 n=1 Tax=Methanogenium organophilum TaxID=2199 RepID=A0A9X9T8Q1_METOG|nr:peptidase M50 [Methanogenium organophilum]WAI02409.1 peptidase M50 [Methanogenium organophilum]